MTDNVKIDSLTEDQMKKIETLEKVQQAVDSRIKENKRIEELVTRTAVATTARTDGRKLVVRDSYTGSLPQWFTLPANAVEATISICGGGGGGGGSPLDIFFVSGGGGSAGETIWKFPLNNGDTIYSVFGKGGKGGNGSLTTQASNGENGGVTIVEGSANFPVGGLRAQGGHAGQAGRAYNRANGGEWIGSNNPYCIGGQAGGRGGMTNTLNFQIFLGEDGWPCYTFPGGISHNVFLQERTIYGGGGGGASMFAKGGPGGHPSASHVNTAIKGAGGGGAGAGSAPLGVRHGGNGGDGIVRLEYYI